MHRFTRRDFLAMSAKATIATTASTLITGCPSGTTPPIIPTDKRAEVAILKGLDLSTMTRDAIETLGGISSFINPGETVFIKPNFGSVGMVHHNPILNGECTKVEIVTTVAEECLKVGASKVIIGDAAQVPSFSWNSIQTLDGTSTMEKEAARLNTTYGGRLTLACLTADSPGWENVPSYTPAGKITISNLVTQADKVISLPVVKTHRWTQITGALKNFVGITSTDHYGMGGPWRFELHNNGIEQSFIDIAAAIKPIFTLIDGSICCEGNGPHVLPGYWGTTLDVSKRLGSYFMVASTDLVAADATAARIIGQIPEKIKHLVMAYTQGLGQGLGNMIDITGESIANVRIDFKAAEPTNGFTDVLIPGIMMLMEK